MADLLGIWNAALGHVGEASTIADRNEPSAAARACRRHWPLARDAVLAEAPWPFARRTVAAAAYTPAPWPWTHAYRHPPDAAGIVAVVDGAGISHDGPLNVGGATDPTGNDLTLILVNAPLAHIVYTRRVEDVGRYPPLFVDALAWRLAWEISVPLSRSREIRADCWQVYQATLQRAMLAAAREQRQAAVESPAILARG